VSHGKKHKKRKRGKIRTMCPRCLTPQDGSSGALLTGLAAALNACEVAGLRVKPWHGGSLRTPGGYVLRLEDDRWAPRTLSYDPLTVPDFTDAEPDD
jgi:hypothetical protein